MAEKDLRVSGLLDIYGEILTEKQRDVIDLYYNEDLSLAEIAEHEGITRQGVRDNIKRGEVVLMEMEEKLHFYKKFQKLIGLSDLIHELCDEIDQKNTGAVSSPDIDRCSRTIRELLDEYTEQF